MCFRNSIKLIRNQLEINKKTDDNSCPVTLLPIQTSQFTIIWYLQQDNNYFLYRYNCHCGRQISIVAEQWLNQPNKGL